MRLSSVLRGQHFGNLAYIRGLVSYKISPFEQYAFSGFSTSLSKIAYRISSSIFKSGPPFAMYWIIRIIAKKKHGEMNRKNPDDYKNDK